MKYISQIINCWKTVFSIRDLSLILGVNNINTLKSIIQRLNKNEILVHRTYWLWSLKKYDFFEFSSKLKKKSYISLETVLQKNWNIFQDYSSSVTLIWDNSFCRQIDGIQYSFFKVKNSILVNPIWIEYRWNYMIASPERAICDRIYLTKNYYFDDLQWLNIELLIKLSKIYNKRTSLSIWDIIKHVKSKYT